MTAIKEKLRGLLAAGPELPEGWTFRRTAAALFLAAFALRAAFLVQWAALPYAAAPCADAWAYENWALEILRGGLLRHTAFYQSPLYPYLLAGVYKLFGHHPAIMLWLQAIAGAFTCVLVYWLGRAAFGARAGLSAGLLAALYRPFIFHTAVAGKETLAVFSVALFAALVLLASGKGRPRVYFWAGLAGGAAVLLRTNAALLLPAALLWLWWNRPAGARRWITGAALPLACGAALAVLPAPLHNWYAAHDLVAVNYNGGFTFFLGNNPEAAGTGIYPAGFSSDPVLEETQPAGIAEKAAGRPLKPSEISGYWLRRGLSFIADEPGHWAVLTAAKFFFFWNRYEIPDNYDQQFIASHNPTLLRLPLFTFALAGCLGALGLFLCRRREASGLLALLFTAYLVSVLPFWVTDRYRLPALALLLPLAGGALHGLLRAAAGEGARAVKAGALAAPLMLICLLPPPFNMRYAEAAGWAQLVNVRAAAGDYAGALAAFGRVAALEPSLLEPDVVYSAAVSLGRLGRRGEAEALLSSAAAAYPDSRLLDGARPK